MGFAQSLWNPGFSGYVTGKSSLHVGDLISVQIDTSTKLTYTSSEVSSQTLTLQFSGGSAGDLLSFLPHGTSSANGSLKSGEELALTTSLATRVVSIDDAGHVFVSGTRSVTVGGHAESISVSGWTDLSSISESRSVPFDRLADSKLVFTTALEQQRPVLTQSDITNVMSAAGQTGGAGTSGAAASQPTAAGTATAGTTPPGAASAGAAGTATAGTAPGTGANAASAQTAGGSGAASPTYALSDEKKRELLLDYLNKMLALIFPDGVPPSGGSSSNGPAVGAGSGGSAAGPTSVGGGAQTPPAAPPQ